MRYTLLELVQDIMSSMDSDEVNSITDTVEAQQVVSIIKTVYDDIISRGDMAIHKTLFNLDPSGDATKPVLMIKPSTIDRIEWIKYNKVLDGDTDPEWSEIRFLPVEDFMNHTQQFVPSNTDVDTMSHTVDGFTFTFNFKNDTGPSYYTSFNDNTIIFDAYDNTVDTTLQTNKTLCYGTKNKTFTETDDFVPDLQPDQFALLLNEAKSLAWAELKQSIHAKAETTARRNWRHLQKTRRHIPDGKNLYKAHPFDDLPNFGRR